MNPSSNHPFRVLVVFESMFGNTEEIARAVERALRESGCAVSVHEVTDPDAPTGTLDVDLVVVGAPTHAFSLSRPTTRAVPLVAFDTRVEEVRRLPMAAGPRAVRLARHQGFAVPVRPAAFRVSDTPGPLLDGEAARAQAWTHSVLSTVRPLAAAGAAGEQSRP